MNICYLCNEEIKEHNSSLEHIIPNSIGGRFKSNEIICKDCNNSTGELFDSVFAKYGNVYASKYNIVRDRGDIPNLTAIEKESGKEVLVKSGWVSHGYLEPYYQKEEHIFFVHSRKRALQELEKRKALLAKAKIEIAEFGLERVVLNEPRTLTFDIHLNTPLFFRSVCKTMANFYYYKTRDTEQIKKLIDFIKNDGENLFSWFLDLNFSKQIHDGKPYHILFVNGDKKRKALYGYFEMFGEKGFITLLNGQYSGPDIQLSYTFDPVTLQEEPLEYTFDIPIELITNTVFYKPYP